MRTVLFSASIVTSLAAYCPAGAEDAAGLAARLEATLEEFQTRYSFPGATAAIALPDGTVATAATGLADIEAGRAMTPDTPMLAASIGKTFVAATVLALESEGRLSRSDLVANHLGSHPWFADLPNAPTMTIGHLLHHGAGLPDHVYLPLFQAAWAQMATGGAGLSPEDLDGFVAGLAPLFEAGAGWVPGYVSSLRHYADHGVTVAFQINTDVGIMDNASALVPALVPGLEAALADLALEAVQ